MTSLDLLTPFSAPPARLNTTAWFDAAHVAPKHSPIDEFHSNLSQINQLYLQASQNQQYTPMLGSLVYMGMVSAAEGYFRSLMRGLILIDPACQHKAYGRTVSYAAAVHHELELLPEALWESLSLASTKNVAGELKSLCNISQMGKDSVPKSLELLFDNFESICQIRHCGIHRFGKLGSQQAFKLGMDDHKPLLEKPLKLTVAHLQDIAEALEALVRAVNSYCFADLLRKTHAAGPTGREQEKLYTETWQRDWGDDGQRFSLYYDLFASRKGVNTSPPAADVYAAFLAYMKDYDASGKNAKAPAKV
jgi:hypothetical protein